MAVLMREILKKWYKHVRFISGIPNFQTHPDDFSWLTHPDTALPPVTGLAGSPSRKDPDARDTTGTRIQRGHGGLCPTSPGALGPLQIFLLCFNPGMMIFWLVVSNTWISFHFIYGMSSFPLTNSIIFQDGFLNHQPVFDDI